MAKHILIDVETYGPCPGIHPMVSFAAICYESKEEFYVELKVPSTGIIVEEARKIANLGLKGEAIMAKDAMLKFEKWLLSQQEEIGERLILVSDSTGFDAGFINYYTHLILEYNPFGHSSVSLNQVYKGMKKDMRVNIGNLRPKGSHTHNALEDCRGNVIALDKMIERGLKFKKEKK